MLPDEPSEEEQRLAPDPPEVPDGDDAPAPLQRQFWRLVVLFNFAVLALSLGLMFAGFEGRLRDGGALIVLGVGIFGYALRDYRQVQEENTASPEDKT